MDTIIYGMGGGKMSDPRMTYHYRRIVEALDFSKTMGGSSENGLFRQVLTEARISSMRSTWPTPLPDVKQ